MCMIFSVLAVWDHVMGVLLLSYYSPSSKTKQIAFVTIVIKQEGFFVINKDFIHTKRCSFCILHYIISIIYVFTRQLNLVNICFYIAFISQYTDLSQVNNVLSKQMHYIFIQCTPFFHHWYIRRLLWQIWY